MSFSLSTGSVPLLVSMPHDGTEIPAELEQRMTPAALLRPDTDWHVSRLYAFAAELGASVLIPRLSRYVVDLNRDPTGRELYPGADNTGIVPLSTFAREPIYDPGLEPAPGEVAERVERWFSPYHAALTREISRILSLHGVCVVFDAHSIRSRVPRFFEGRLPDLNLGSADGRSAEKALCERAWAVLDSGGDYTRVCNGRFKGGYITRFYGRPSQGVHALQLELAQACYMQEEPPFELDPQKTARLQRVLRSLLGALIDWTRERSA